MKVLVIGNGGREDAICKKISESNSLNELFCSPGNGGTLRYAKNIDLKDNSEVLNFCKEKNIDLVIIGPEAPLCTGIVDLLNENNIMAFGASRKSSILESSKDFAKSFMEKYDLPTARYTTISSKSEGIKAISKFSYPLVIKADGLCAGKGVKICNTQKDATDYLIELFDNEIFGLEGKKAVIEEFLTGKEASLLCIVSGNKIIPMESARDYKRIYDNDEGDNTGGVGCYSPSELFNSKLEKNIEIILEKISDGLKKESLEYSGILFIGFMIENNYPKILEFNVRFGDPETEVVLPRLESDLLEIMVKSLNGSLCKDDLKWKKEKSLTVILTSKGYPHYYEKGKIITGIEDIDSDIYVYHNNTVLKDNTLLTAGGRVLSVTSFGSSYEEIRNKIYSNIDKIHFDGMSYRKDIGIVVEEKNEI